ncbi:hypothetical protein J4421_03050 [Candidatus Woesearchaeota archaeon]|nr:hypothetical protein [Candidatus Woesearchaeota archaeon]
MNVWKLFAQISIVCALLTYSIGWGALLSSATIWGIETEFWFYDAVAAGIFGVFFLMYGSQSKQLR